LERIQQVPLFAKGVAFITDQPVPHEMRLGRFCITVSMQGGSFNQKHFEASAHEQLTIDSQIAIGVFRQLLVDKPGHSTAAMLGNRGVDENLFEMGHKLLQCLLVADPTKGRLSQAWEPSVNGIPLLREIPSPVRFTDPSDVPGYPGYLGQVYYFAVTYDWDLYRAE
jgi:hypothetical protein